MDMRCRRLWHGVALLVFVAGARAGAGDVETVTGDVAAPDVVIPTAWVTELDTIRGDVVVGLQSVMQADGGASRVSPFDAAFIVSHWHHPDFQEPLFALLQHPDVIPVRGMAVVVDALLGYRDPLLMARLERLAKDAEAPEVVTRAIRAALARYVAPPAAAAEPERGDDLLGMLQRLRHPELSQRRAAFLRLAHNRMIFDMGPVLESWDGLSEAERIELLEAVGFSIWGDDQARDGLASLAKRGAFTHASPEIEAAFLAAAAQVGSDVARDLALRVVQEAIDSKLTAESEPWEHLTTFERLSGAFLALRETPDKEVVERALQWSRSDDTLLRAGGVWLLTGAAEPRAFAVVVHYLEDERGHPWNSSIRPFDGIAARNWNRVERTRLVQAVGRALARAMRARPEDLPPCEMYEDLRPVEDYVCLLNDLTGTSRGDTRLRSTAAAWLDALRPLLVDDETNR